MKDLLNFDHNILQICWKLFRFAADGLKYWWQRVFWVRSSSRGEAAGPSLPLFYPLTPPHLPSPSVPCRFHPAGTSQNPAW